MKRLATALATLAIALPVGGALASTAGTDVARTGDYVVGETSDGAFGGTLVGVGTPHGTHRPVVILRQRRMDGTRTVLVPMDQITQIGR